MEEEYTKVIRGSKKPQFKVARSTFILYKGEIINIFREYQPQLELVDLLVFSIIYNFTFVDNGKSKGYYYGSIDNLANLTLSCRNRVRKALERLIKCNYILKKDQWTADSQCKFKTLRFKANLPLIENLIKEYYQKYPEQIEEEWDDFDEDSLTNNQENSENVCLIGIHKEENEQNLDDLCMPTRTECMPTRDTCMPNRNLCMPNRDTMYAYEAPNNIYNKINNKNIKKEYNAISETEISAVHKINPFEKDIYKSPLENNEYELSLENGKKKKTARLRREVPITSRPLNEMLGERLSDIDNNAAKLKKQQKELDSQNELPASERKIKMVIKRLNPITNKYISDIEVKQCLEDYIRERVDAYKGKKLTNGNWEDIIKELLEKCPNKQDQIESIKQSKLHGWFEFYPPRKDKNHSYQLNNQQHINELKYGAPELDLAKDENGNILEF